MTPMELEINGVSSEPKELANIQSSELRQVKTKVTGKTGLSMQIGN